jgi:hypothetical protein
MTKCIFCAEPFDPSRRRSAEHAAPQWCRDLVPDLGPAQHTMVTETGKGYVTRDWGLRDPFTTVVKDVCESCNTGWMSEMEESRRPLLTHFIQGEPRRFRYWRQLLTATWAIKTAMVWESVAPQSRTVPLEVLETFHRTQRPNLRQQVWIGRYGGPDPHSFRRTAAHVVGPVSGGSGNPQDAHAYLVVLTVGELALAVFGHLLGIPHEHRLPEPLEAGWTPIWPPTREVAEWPPVDSLDDERLELTVRSLGLPIAGFKPAD